MDIIKLRPTVLETPFFYKTDSNAKNQLEQLKRFYKTAPNITKPRIEQDIRMLNYGILGEDTVAFELKNSHLPLIVLHDLNIEYEDLSAQIDYLVITPKFHLFIECKNLIGNIEVNSNGDFIRTLKYNGRYNKEGIYSPITQNIRHIELIKKIKRERKTNRLAKILFDKYFYDFHKSVVVLANPKTVINMKYAKKEIKNQIIRSDQLISHIRKMLSEDKDLNSKTKEMFEDADLYYSLHTPNNVDYTQKYNITDNEEIKGEITTKQKSLYMELKQYRYEISKKENIKAYYIYTNSQMESLIDVMPGTLEDIKKISGFGDEKCRKYGQEILDIIQKYK